MPPRASLLLIIAAAGAIASAAPAAPTHDKAAVKAFLRHHLARPDPQQEAANPTRVSIAWSDLNGDGRREAIALLRSGSYCGTGGCDLFVLQPTPKDFKVRGQLSLGRSPVGVLRTSTHGWRDITVFVAGGGILPGYVARVPFRGKTYAYNPSMPPARRLAPGERPTVILPYGKGERLY